jgi:two-component system sensor histidine kinase KdpD
MLEGRPIETHLPPELPLVSVDDGLLEQVFINLVENAVKYTPAGSPIEISAAEEGDNVRVEFADRGPGFAPGEEQHIFEKFYRGNTKGARGAGLGLAICRAIVRAHSGAVEAQNRPGGGAVIRIRLPIGGSPSAIHPALEAVDRG